MGPLVPLDLMTPEEEEALIAAMVDGDDEAARSHLAAGNPIYYVASNTPPGVVEKLFPGGRRQYIRFDLDGEHLVADNVQSVSER